MEIISKKKYDHRQLKITDTDQQQYITNLVEEWIDLSEYVKQIENMVSIWNTNALYREGYNMPIGFTDTAIDEAVKMLDARGFLDTTKFNTKKDDKNRIWISDNKIGKIIDGMKAYLTSSKKVITVRSDDYPGNNGIEYAIRHLLEYQQTEKHLWEQLWNPCIDYVQTFGLAWYDIIYNRRINAPYGDFQFNYYHPKDVLFDMYSKLKYYLDSRFIIRKKQMEVEEAREYFSERKFGLKEDDIAKIKGDTDYNRYNPYYQSGNFQTRLGSTIEFTTVYYGEYKQKYTNKASLSEELGLNDMLKENQIEIQDEIEVDEQWQFDFIYTPALGVVYHGESKYYDKTDFANYQYSCIPMINRETTVRQHPQSEVEKLIKLQDLINISKTLMFENARQQNYVRYIMKSTFKKYESTFMKFLQGSGVFWAEGLSENEKVQDAIQQVKPATLPPEILAFLQMTIEDIKENGVIHESLAGEYPEKGSISGVAVEKLRRGNMQRLQYKEDNINWACSTGGSRMYRIYATEYKMDDYIRLTNRTKNDPNHLVLNGIFTLAQYEKYIQDNYPTYDIRTATQLFEKENDVEIQYSKTNNEGLPEDADKIIQENSLVYVNMLIDPKTNNPYRMKIKVEMDFDSERDKQELRIIATNLRANREISRKDYFKFLGEPFVENYEELEKNLSEESKIMQTAEMLAKNPEIAQLVDKVIQNVQQQNQPQQNG